MAPFAGPTDITANMAEEFQNTISLYGNVEVVEEIAQRIGSALFENIEIKCTYEFILL